MAKIKSDSTPEELLAIIQELCTANIQEIEFNDVMRICLQLGCTYQDSGKKRKSGSAETFFHPKLKDFHQYHGYVSVHLIHGGGSKRKLYKRNFVNYLAPGLVLIAKQLIEEKQKGK